MHARMLLIVWSRAIGSEVAAPSGLVFRLSCREAGFEWDFGLVGRPGCPGLLERFHTASSLASQCGAAISPQE